MALVQFGHRYNNFLVHKISILAIIYFFLKVFTSYSVDKGNRAIKVHVNKPHYCKAGHILFCTPSSSLRQPEISYNILQRDTCSNPGSRKCFFPYLGNYTGLKDQLFVKLVYNHLRKDRLTGQRVLTLYRHTLKVRQHPSGASSRNSHFLTISTCCL